MINRTNKTSLKQFLPRHKHTQVHTSIKRVQIKPFFNINTHPLKLPESGFSISPRRLTKTKNRFVQNSNSSRIVWGLANKTGIRANRHQTCQWQDSGI